MSNNRGSKPPKFSVQGAGKGGRAPQKLADLRQALDIAVQYFDKGDLANSQALCTQAMKQWPSHPVAPNLLGIIAMARNDNTQAAAYFKRSIEIKSDYPDAHYNLGNVLMAQRQQAQAIVHFKKTIELNPAKVDAYYNLGNAFKALGRPEEALAQYQRTLELQPGHADAHNNSGNVLKTSGRFEQAVEHYRHAIHSRPNYAAAHYNLGTVLQTLGRTAEAIKHYQTAIEIQPELAVAHSNLGAAYRSQGDFDKAISHYQHAIRLQPGFAVAHNNLAAMYERTNQLDAAESANKTALEIAPGNADSLFIQALVQRRQGNAEAALAGFEALDDTALTKNYAQRRWFELGKLRDTRGEYEASLEAFSQGNRMHAASEDAARVKAERYRSRIAAVGAALAPAWINTWNEPAVPQEAVAPVFVVGFPRSGTTLLDQVLDSHPRLQVMEERRAFGAVEALLEKLSGPYPQALARLSKPDIASLRTCYFDTVAQHFELRPGQMLVDKFPLNIEYLPLIHRLFPGAHIIFAARHPCDVVLSNFMQYYQLNDAMANFFTLEDAAQLYQQVLDLWLRCVETLPLNVHYLQYEALVADFDSTARRLFEFLALDWDEGVAEFHLHAGRKNIINTPSYDQVTKPLYSSASGRWHNYSAQLGPFVGGLTPYIEQLGYGE